MERLNIDDITNALKEVAGVSDYKIVNTVTESYEQFFVHGKLETVRECVSDDRNVTVYSKHDGKLGSSSFDVTASLDAEALKARIEHAVSSAALCFDDAYSIPENDTCIANIPSNLADMDAKTVAKRVADTVKQANCLPGCDVNALEVFVVKKTVRVLNSRGIDKTQTKYTLSVEAIPTCNGEEQSVELFETYTLAELDEDWLRAEISARLEDVAARLKAVKPAQRLTCPVIFNAYELKTLFENLVADCNMAYVYAHANLLSVGDALQSAPRGDKLSITMRAAVKGSPASAVFDQDGTTLRDRQIIKDGRIVALFGSHRFAQYLGQEETGALQCIDVECGSTPVEALTAGPHLELIYLSGLQVDVYNDYIGSEVRLAYYCDGKERVPVTGIAISGKLSDVLNTVTLSSERTVSGSYVGPEKVKADGFNIF